MELAANAHSVLVRVGSNVRALRGGRWGGHIELAVLRELFNVNVEIYHRYDKGYLCTYDIKQTISSSFI
eukprot:565417-Amorphochlora_amoeboformis.AAC.1